VLLRAQLPQRGAPLAVGEQQELAQVVSPELDCVFDPFLIC
jgi:hypothetical protein